MVGAVVGDTWHASKGKGLRHFEPACARVWGSQKRILKCRVIFRQPVRQQGDEFAERWLTDWPYILRTHGPMAVRAAYRILGRAADAEDALQQAFLEALELQRRGPVKNWPALLRHLATCRALDLLRKRTVAADLTRLAPAAAAGPEAVAIAREHAELLREGLA